MPFIQHGGEARPVGPGVLTIGGGREAAWRIEGKGLLPRHALLTLERDGGVTVVAASAEAAVYVNGERLAGARTLAAGDVFVLAEASFSLVDEAPPAAEGEEGFFVDLRRSRVYPLGDGGKIGREAGSLVLLQEPDVAKVQAEVRRNGPSFTLAPMAPHTLLNGVKVSDPTPLREGDEIGIGLTTLRFTRRAPGRDLIDGAARATPDQRRRAQERLSTAGAATSRSAAARLTPRGSGARSASRSASRTGGRPPSRLWLWVTLVVVAVLVGAAVAAWQRGVLWSAEAWGVRVDVRPHGDRAAAPSPAPSAAPSTPAPAVAPADSAARPATDTLPR